MPETPQFPEALEYLWNAFIEIISGSAPGFGPATVTWEGLRAWCELTDERLEPWEVRALVRLGLTRVNILSEQAERNRGDNGQN